MPQPPDLDLDPEALGDIIAQAKRHLRNRMRGLREALPERAWAVRNERVLARLHALPELARARRLALFAPMRSRREIDLTELAGHLLGRGAQLYYPFMDPVGDGYRTGFRSAASLTELVHRGRGFREPDPARVAAVRGGVDLVIVPALAAAPTGHRVGYGAGFYDATLPDVCPPARSVVVVLDFQLTVEVPTTEQDVACDFVVTESAVIRAAGA
jgi:5-formyltetrahydrofolate cyclo-ligase